MNLNEHTTVPFFFSPMMLVTKTYICCCSGPLCLILQPIKAPPVERCALGSLSGVGSFFMGPAASVWVQWMIRCCENSSSLIFHEGHIPHTLPDASRRFPWENCISAFLTVSLLSIFLFFFCSSNPSGLFLLLQVLLPTLCQHTRSQRSCSSLWARSQCLGSTQRCPLQAQGKCLSDGCDFQQLLQCNRSGRPLNKTAAGEMWMCYFVCLWKFFIWLVSSWLRPQPRGNQDDSGYAAQVFGAGRHSGL